MGSKIIRSSLDGLSFDLTKRRSGKTRRVIDNAINILFEDGVVKIEDHPRDDYVKAMEHQKIYVAKRIISRLNFEYNFGLSIKKNYKDGIFVLNPNPNCEEVYSIGSMSANGDLLTTYITKQDFKDLFPNKLLPKPIKKIPAIKTTDELDILLDGEEDEVVYFLMGDEDYNKTKQIFMAFLSNNETDNFLELTFKNKVARIFNYESNTR